MTSPIPPAAIGAAAPTSRSTFRLLAKSFDATNREADALRHALLAQWTERATDKQLVDRLRLVDRSDPDGALGAEARLAVWCYFTDPGDGRLIDADDAVLTGLSDELRARLSEATRPATD